MDDRKGMVWYLINGAMELSWLMACAMFYSQTVMHRPFPFFETIAVFALAGFLTHFSTGKGWRIVMVLMIQLLGLAAAALLVVHAIDYASYALLEGGWLDLFFHGSRSPMEWIIVFLNLVLVIIVWVSGAALSRRPKGHSIACNRFDLGIAVFFALFLIRFVALTKGEPLLEDTLSRLFIFPFFVFGLLSVGVARMRGNASKSFLSGYRGIGVIASFAAVVLLGTLGLLLFFLPGLTAAAQIGYNAVAAVGRPIVPVLIAILRFIFRQPAREPAAVAQESSPLGHLDAASQQHGWLMELVEKILGWGIWGFMIFILLLGSGLILFCIVKWLLSRTEGEGRPMKPFPSLLAALLALLAAARLRIIRAVRGYRKAAELYGALLGWAGRSGLPHGSHETPSEFGTRLNACFPALSPPIALIIDAYNREVYGETPLDGESLRTANTAWQFLRSPLRWPARFRGWLSGSSPTEEEI